MLKYVDNIFIALQFESNYWRSYRMRASSKEIWCSDMESTGTLEIYGGET